MKMKAISKYLNDVRALERSLADDVARLTAELEPFPPARDAEALNDAWAKTSFSRGKLARLLRGGLKNISDSDVTGSQQRHELRSARKDLKDTKRRLGIWSRVVPAIEKQLWPEQRELIEYDLRSNIELKVFDHVIDLFLTSMHTLANPNAHTQSDAARNRGCHRDIPLPMDRFSQMVSAAHRVCLALKRERPLRFLDVGSGGGTKVLAASTTFEFCDGLEYDEPIVDSGRLFLQMLRAERCSLIHGDALSFSDYGAYDVIYFYRPLKLSDLNAELEDRIISQVRPGTVLLNAGGTCFDDLASRGVHELAYQVFVTGMTENEATELLENAKFMGPMIPQFRPATVFDPGYWRPLLEVLARNGYFV